MKPGEQEKKYSWFPGFLINDCPVSPGFFIKIRLIRAIRGYKMKEKICSIN